MNSPWEQFQSATLSLARCGSIKERLAEAYILHLGEIQEEDLPRELREDFRELTRTMRREAPLHKREDPVRATVRKMSNDEASRCACAVVKLFAAMSRATAAPARNAPGGTVVQLYAAEA
jgi:hypothetical protein